MEITRKLASACIIDDIQSINGADAIEVAAVGGWKVVVKKGDFQKGDLAIYFEIDSWIPNELAPFLSRNKEPREYNGVKGERLRTIKLRGQISQGLLLPLHQEAVEGDDFTEALCIQKWERPVSVHLRGEIRGDFPHFIFKTDQERVQSLSRMIQESFDRGDEFEVTEKLDGSSMTVYHNSNLNDSALGVCSRNIELKLDQEGNSFVDMAHKTGLLELLGAVGRNIAVQGELCGEKIQGNNEKLVGIQFAIFDIFDIDTQKYLTPEQRRNIFTTMKDGGFTGRHVPVIHQSFKLPSGNIEDLLKMAEGKNAAGNEREGLVFKRIDGKFSFKAISNKFLLEEDTK